MLRDSASSAVAPGVRAALVSRDGRRCPSEPLHPMEPLTSVALMTRRLCTRVAFRVRLLSEGTRGQMIDGAIAAKAAALRDGDYALAGQITREILQPLIGIEGCLALALGRIGVDPHEVERPADQPEVVRVHAPLVARMMRVHGRRWNALHACARKPLPIRVPRQVSSRPRRLRHAAGRPRARSPGRSADEPHLGGASADVDARRAVCPVPLIDGRPAVGRRPA